MRFEDCGSFFQIVCVRENDFCFWMIRATSGCVLTSDGIPQTLTADQRVEGPQLVQVEVSRWNGSYLGRPGQNRTQVETQEGIGAEVGRWGKAMRKENPAWEGWSGHL